MNRAHHEPLDGGIDDSLGRSQNLRAFREYEPTGRYWKVAFPGRTLAQIVPGDIERYLAPRVRDVAPAMVNRELSFLRRVFNVTIADGNADKNPVRAVKFFNENNERVRFLTEDEEELVAAKVPDPLYWSKIARPPSTPESSYYR